MAGLNDERARSGTNIRLQTWSVVELGLAILAACLAALRPLVRYLTTGGNSHTTTYAGGGGGGGGCMTGHFVVKQARALELPEVGNETSSVWSGRNSHKRAEEASPKTSGVMSDTSRVLIG